MKKGTGETLEQKHQSLTNILKDIESGHPTVAGNITAWLKNQPEDMQLLAIMMGITRAHDRMNVIGELVVNCLEEIKQTAIKMGVGDETTKN